MSAPSTQIVDRLIDEGKLPSNLRDWAEAVVEEYIGHESIDDSIIDIRAAKQIAACLWDINEWPKAAWVEVAANLIKFKFSPVLAHKDGQLASHLEMIEQLKGQLLGAAKAIDNLANNIPAPNPHTPEFMSLAIAMRKNVSDVEYYAAQAADKSQETSNDRDN